MSDFSWWNLLSRHWGKILGGLIGLVFALLIVKFGFWKGIFIMICIAVGIYIGWRIDENKGLRNLLERFLPPRDEF